MQRMAMNVMWDDLVLYFSYYCNIWHTAVVFVLSGRGTQTRRGLAAENGRTSARYGKGRFVDTDVRTLSENVAYME